MVSVQSLDPIDLSLPIWRDDPRQLQSELLGRISTGVVLHADLPRPLDTLLVQLMLATRAATDAAGTQFAVKEPSQAVQDGLRLLGLHERLLT